MIYITHDQGGLEMRTQKKYVAALAILAVAALLSGWFFMTHIYIGGRFYPRIVDHMDFGGKALTAEQYLELHSHLPDCEIRWDVPFQGTTCPNDSRELTVTALSDADLELLDFFPALETVYAENCTDYSRLAALQQTRPELDIRYNVTVDGQVYPQDAEKITISAITDEEIGLLQYLPELTEIDATGCSDPAPLMKLKERYPQCALTYSVSISGISVPENAEELTLTGADPKEVLQMLEYLPHIRTVTLIDPATDGESLSALPQQYPDVSFRWEMDVLGTRVTTDDTDLDFSGIQTEELEHLETALSCFPNLETVYLGECGIDNEVLSAYRDRVRKEYKVVWLLRLDILTVRTDAVYFMPAKDNYYCITNEHMDLMRYCEDLVCVDLGHIGITRCDWVEDMPKLKYLLLGDTDLESVAPIAKLKELVYLEVFLTRVTDYAPLLECTSIRDLNLGFTKGDPEPLKQMTWLDRLWWSAAPVPKAEIQEFLPDTILMFDKASSTGNGWRESQNYYDMRDLMGMPYMHH